MRFLTEPSECYRESYLTALREFQAEGKNLKPSFEEVAAHFPGFLQHMRDQGDRSKLKPGRVPSSEFWLIDGDDYVGSISLRHELTEDLVDKGGHIGYKIRPSRRQQGYGTLILCYGLEQARALGLTRVLLTCDEQNLGSRKVIESNGGVLENSIQLEAWPEKICRYWIALSENEGKAHA